jgi:hypothetical protein
MHNPAIRTEDFATSFLLLQQEGYLTRSALTTGLSALSSAHPGEKGLYYAAFFQLTIGIERFLKLILIIEHMGAHSLRAPSSKELKAYGHDLRSLFQEAQKRAPAGAAKNASELMSDVTVMRILAFFSDFAERTRYHNLNTIGTATSAVDPLFAWQNILTDLLLANVSKKKLEEQRDRVRALATLMETNVRVVGHDMKQQPLSLESALLRPLENRAATPFAIWEIYRLLTCLAYILSETTSSAQSVDVAVGGGPAHIPYMNEFFLFLNQERRDVLRKRRWP